MKTPKSAVCITKRRLKKSAGFSLSSHAKITVNGPIIPVRRTMGELKPSTPNSKEIPNEGAHSYSSIKENPDSLPALKNTTIESKRVKSVVKRAIILGENSYGKGSVQSIIPLRNGGGIRLTISKYYLPSGKSISEVGVTPDIVIEEEGDDFTINTDKDNQLNYAIKLFNS